MLGTYRNYVGFRNLFSEDQVNLLNRFKNGFPVNIQNKKDLYTAKELMHVGVVKLVVNHSESQPDVLGELYVDAETMEDIDLGGLGQ